VEADVSTQHESAEEAERGSPPPLAVVVIAYESRQMLGECLDSIRAYGALGGRPAEIHVVDNASADGTVEMVRQRYPDVIVHRLPRNLGFSTGNNVALRLVRSPWVLLLNPDAAIQEDTIPTLVDLMERRPEIGMVGCKLVKPDGTLDHAAKRSFPTFLGAIGHFLRVGRSDVAPRALRQYRAPLREGAGPVDAVNGAFMLIRREALDEVGHFDEGYWMYGEDLDLCYRFAQAGWSVWYEPSVAAMHIKAGTTGRHRPFRQNRAFHEAMVRFYRKFYAPRYPAPLNALVYAGIGVKFASSVVTNAVSRRLERRRRR